MAVSRILGLIALEELPDIADVTRPLVAPYLPIMGPGSQGGGDRDSSCRRWAACSGFFGSM